MTEAKIVCIHGYIDVNYRFSRKNAKKYALTWFERYDRPIVVGDYLERSIIHKKTFDTVKEAVEYSGTLGLTMPLSVGLVLNPIDLHGNQKFNSSKDAINFWIARDLEQTAERCLMASCEVLGLTVRKR